MASNLRGVVESGSILDRIVQDLRPVTEKRRNTEPESSLRERTAEHAAQWSLSKAIRTPRGKPPATGVQIIAEIKKASPSKGELAATLDAPKVARAYAQGGATGISIVTEPNYFRGELQWLLDVRRALADGLPETRPSLLRKDFIVDPYELVQARAYGADNVLLIVAILGDALLRDLLAQARDLDLDALVEVHTQDEAERAVRAGASLFGINNRDLHTFEVDLGVTERIRPLLPQGAIVVGESGVHNSEDVGRLQAAGVQAILVGEAFMTAADIPAKMAELMPGEVENTSAKSRR